MIKELKLPELGEKLTTAVVLTILVAEGDTVDEEQPVLELENEKATAELPSPFAGTVAEILVAEDDEIEVGQTVMTVEVEDEADEEGGDDEPDTERGASETEPEEGEGEAEEAEQDEGEAEAREEEAEEKPEPDQEAEDQEKEDERESEARDETLQPPRRVRPGPGGPVAAEGPETSPEGYVPAGPASRRLARELGLDISAVAGSGPDGRISLDDVKAAARELITSRRRPPRPATGGERPELPDPERWGPATRHLQGTVKRLTAEAMARSWSEIPMVTHHDRADISELEERRDQFKGQVEEAGGRLTLTAIVVKVVAAAVRVHPRFNAVYDPVNDAVITRDYVNVAFAVDTEHGLLVPVIRDADRKSTVQIALELGELARRARDRKLDREEIEGAGITVSNVGGMGTTDFSPIVNWPEVAIVGVGRAATEAVWTGDGFSPRLMLPLSLTYDHRVNDGAEASRFLRWIAEALETPLKLVMEPAGG